MVVSSLYGASMSLHATVSLGVYLLVSSYVAPIEYSMAYIDSSVAPIESSAASLESCVASIECYVAAIESLVASIVYCCFYRVFSGF